MVRVRYLGENLGENLYYIPKQFIVRKSNQQLQSELHICFMADQNQDGHILKHQILTFCPYSFPGKNQGRYHIRRMSASYRFFSPICLVGSNDCRFSDCVWLYLLPQTVSQSGRRGST